MSTLRPYNNIEKIVNCKNGYKCIRSNSPEIHHVIFGKQKKVLFVDCKENFICGFKNLFGDSCYCSCPVRLEYTGKIANN